MRGRHRLRAVTYNIHSGIGRDRRYAPDRVIEVMRGLDADLIGLQEVVSRPGHDGPPDEIMTFAAEAGLAAVAGPNVVIGQANFGNLLLSRWPVVETRLIDLSVPHFEPRGAIDVDLDVAGRPVRVVATHLGVRVRERRRQLAALAALVGAPGEGPLIMMGDFNVWGLEALSLRRLGHPIARARAPASFPAGFPVLALDRIWTRPADALTRVHAQRSGLARVASDHLPVVAEVTLPDAPAG